MPSLKRTLWQAFDAAEKTLGPRLEDAVRSGPFLEALGLATRAQDRVRRDLEARSRRVWHLVNLPAGSDVRRLRHQVAALDRELQQVRAALEAPPPQPQEGRDGSRAASPGRAAGPRAPRRRAQRAEGP